MVFRQNQGKNKIKMQKESTWNNYPNEYTYQAFYNQRHHCSNIVKSAQRQYFMEKISENQYNYKEIFRLTNKLLGKDNGLPLPPTEDLSALANGFNNYLMSKIRKIMQDLAPNNITDTSDDYLESAFETTERLMNFKLVTVRDILSILHTAPSQSCELDLIPTTLLKVYSSVVVPYIMGIVNMSIASGSFTKNIKKALLRPLLKKMGWTWPYAITD